MWLHPVSRSQAERAPQRAILQPPIPNGVDVDALYRPHARRDFALVLSRICPEKGIHLALEAARLADLPLLVGGQAYGYQAHVDYLHGAVQPMLDARRRFLGPLGFARKRRFLNAASCLVIPSLAAETSSLVAMEALACGTPVVAFPHGALPDIIEHGRTGFIVNDVAEMAQAMLAARSIDPQECRRAARSRFSLEVMIERYLGAYLALAAMRTGEAAQ
jgi:glycosyltransferase involved in cell wall biosynthesis